LSKIQVRLTPTTAINKLLGIIFIN